jgi:hypothetical protein
MTKSYSYFSRLRDKPKRTVARPPVKLQTPSKRLSLVATTVLEPDRQADGVSSLAAVGPSNDF